MIVYLKLNITFVVEKEKSGICQPTHLALHIILYISLQEIEFLSSRNHFFYSASFANSASWSAINLP